MVSQTLLCFLIRGSISLWSPGIISMSEPGDYFIRKLHPY